MNSFTINSTKLQIDDWIALDSILTTNIQRMYICQIKFIDNKCISMSIFVINSNKVTSRISQIDFDKEIVEKLFIKKLTPEEIKEFKVRHL